MLLANIRYGIRLMLRNPAFGMGAVGVISIGIGATTAVFTLIRAVLLTSLTGVEGMEAVVAASGSDNLLALGSAVGFVLLVACANLGNLLLARRN